MYPYFNIFGRLIGSYALCATIGFLVCGLLAWRLGKRKNIVFEDLLLAMVAMVVGLLAGGHILYGITNIGGIIDVLSKASDFGFVGTLKNLVPMFSGSVFYGGFIGGTIAILIYTKFSKSIGRSDLIDIWAVLTPLFHFFGRLGCFFGGCCYGIESHFGFTVNGNTLVPDINGVKRFPVALLEAAFNLAIFFILLYLTNRHKAEGKRLFIYMLLYSPVRFSVEFLRGDEIRGFLFGLSTSQWISIALFIVGLTALIFKAKYGGKTDVQEKKEQTA